MEKITIKGLTQKLNDIKYEGMETSEVLVLKDTIWGIANGVYKPLGELQLPIQYANGKFNDRDDEWVNCYDLLTIFTNNFFRGRVKRQEGIGGADVPRYITDVIDGIEGNFSLYITEKGWSDETSRKEVVQRFLTKYFKLHQASKEVDNEEARQCLQRSFVKYK